MLEAVIKHGMIFYVMGIAVVIGIFAKVISHITAGKMVKAASEIQKSNHRFMRLVKSKFEHASMVSDKVQNVDAFVNKYLYEYKVLGVRLDTWRGLQKKMIWLTLAIGLCGVLASWNLSGTAENLFRYISVTAICTILLVSVQIMSDEKEKLNAARNYIVDYLENVCIHRYEKAGQAVQDQEGAEKKEVTLQAAESEHQKEKMDQEMRIRAILEEFLA